MPIAYQLACAEAGQPDCAFLVRSENREEVVEAVRTHAREAHDASYSAADVEGQLSEVEWAQP
jgi:predicted small metal-binding protein